MISALQPLAVTNPLHHVPAGAWVIGLLGFPGDDAALDVNLPRAGARAVHAVGGAHDLVVRPAVAVGVLPAAVFAGGDTCLLYTSRCV